MLVYAKHGLLQLLQQLLSPHQHHQRCPSQSVSQSCFACVKTITETIDELTKSLGLVPCRLLQNNPEIREKKILGVHLACLLAEQSNTGFVNSETDNRIGGYVTDEQQQQQQQQHIWVGAGLEKKGFLFLCCSNYWCFCLFTGGG